MLTRYFAQDNAAGLALRAGPAVVLALAMVVLSGCHSYRPMLESDPVPGDRVRVRLSSEAASDVSRLVNSPVASVSGTVMAVQTDSLTLNASWGAIFAGTRFAARRDTLTFERTDLLQIERRELSRGRSAVVLGALAAMAIALYRTFGGGGDPSSLPEPGNPPVF